MACCDNTLDLGCINHCNQLSFGEATISGTYNGVFTSGNIQITQQITVTSGNPFIFDMTLLNEQMSYTLVIYNSDNEQITLTIDSVEYNCFTVKTVLDGVVVPFVPVEGCTPMCKEIYDPNNESTPVVFNIIAGTNVTVDNTDPSNPIVSSSGGGGGIESIVAGTNITVDNTDPLNPIVSASGGSIPISGLTAATATNTINNGAYSQEWQWNSQTNAPMLTISSTSTGAVTGGDGFVVNLSGTIANGQTNYAAKFINKRVSAGAGFQVGGYFEGPALGVAIQTKHSGTLGASSGANIAIGSNGSLFWNNGNFNGSFITSKYNTPQFYFNSVGSFNFRSSSLIGSIFSTVDTRAEIVLGLQSATRSSISFGGDNGAANGTQYRSESVTSCIIERNLGKLLFSTNVGLSGGYANFTPTYQICVDGTNNNVAIGKGNTAGDASAKLEVVSTTQGFLPPRMTTTQRDAISSPATFLMIGNTTTGKLNFYNGAAWEVVTSV